ncbi:hypothetical protein [Vibrio sp. YIC-376]|uniref:hypothetical protein n=1 Tax=Vibrio sp. YIC-376 TaxID=3136162 RepID=UPI00402AFC5B
MDDKTYSFTTLATEITFYGSTGHIQELESTINADLTLRDFSDHVDSKLGARIHIEFVP